MPKLVTGTGGESGRVNAYLTLRGAIESVATGGSVISPFWILVSNAHFRWRVTYLVKKVDGIAFGALELGDQAVVYGTSSFVAIKADKLVSASRGCHLSMLQRTSDDSWLRFLYCLEADEVENALEEARRGHYFYPCTSG